jgi:hypothetical protein
MCHVTTIQKVRNYQGNNKFVLSIKDSLQKWGTLTDKQLSAVEKVLNSQTQVNKVTIPEYLNPIVNYEGENTFIKDIKEKLLKYGTLTQPQIEACLKAIERTQNKMKTIQLDLPTIGETIKIGRRKGQELKEKYNLKFNPIFIDIVEIKAMSPKAVHFAGKMTIKRGDVCMCCAKTLTDEFSMLTKMGKTCAQHMGIQYITDKSQAEKFRNEYLQKVEEIGIMNFWIPKSKIIKWDGKSEVLLKFIDHN